MQDTPSIGDAEKFLMRHKDALLSGLATLLVRKNVESVDELMGLSQPNGIFDITSIYVFVLFFWLLSTFLYLDFEMGCRSFQTTLCSCKYA